MAVSGTSGFCMALSLLTLVTTFPPSFSHYLSPKPFPMNPEELTFPIETAISHSLDEYNDRIAKHPDQFTLLVAMVMNDLYPNVSNKTDYYHRKWNTMVNWLQLAGIQAPSTNAGLNLTNLYLEHSFAVQPRSSKFGNFYKDIDRLDYLSVLRKWRNEMEKMTSVNFLSTTKRICQRKVEMGVSMLPKWKQLVLAGSYFERVTLPKILDPFCNIGSKNKINLPAHYYFIWSLVNTISKQSASTRNLATYMSWICPVSNLALQLEISSLNQTKQTPDQYYRQEMIVPDEMKLYVFSVMTHSTRIPVTINGDAQMVIIYSDAIKWIEDDYAQYLSESESSVSASFAPQKIVYYLTVLQQSKQFSDQTIEQVIFYCFTDYAKCEHKLALIVFIIVISLFLINCLASVIRLCFCKL